MACNCKKHGGHMAPAPKPKDTSKVTVPEKKETNKDDGKKE